MMEIERPKIETAALSPDGRYGKFVVEPLERGFGTTLGNSLRRVLLSSLPGVAVTSVKIDGVVHEFTTIEGVREDVTEIVLNLKGIAAKIYGEAPKTVRVEAVGPCEVTAGTIKGGDDLEILNPEWHIATLGEGAKLVMELTFDKGRGYVPAEKNKQALIEKNDISTLPVDSIYTPVLKVNYTVDRTRVGQITDFDKLIMEVWTDGTCNAQEALSLAARVLTVIERAAGNGQSPTGHRWRSATSPPRGEALCALRAKQQRTSGCVPYASFVPSLQRRSRRNYKLLDKNTFLHKFDGVPFALRAYLCYNK